MSRDAFIAAAKLAREQYERLHTHRDAVEQIAAAFDVPMSLMGQPLMPAAPVFPQCTLLIDDKPTAAIFYMCTRSDFKSYLEGKFPDIPETSESRWTFNGGSLYLRDTMAVHVAGLSHWRQRTFKLNPPSAYAAWLGDHFDFDQACLIANEICGQQAPRFPFLWFNVNLGFLNYYNEWTLNNGPSLIS